MPPPAVFDRGELKGTKSDLISCLEVFNHLPDRQTAKTVRIVDRLLADGGVFVVGVPNELFFPTLVKGVFRTTRRYGSHDAVSATSCGPPSGGRRQGVRRAGSRATSPTTSTTSASTTAG